MIGTKSLGASEGVQPKNEAQINTVKNKLKSLVQKRNVSLLGDQLINQMADGRFDIAVSYNGDILYGEQSYMHLDDDDDSNDMKDHAFAYATPTNGTNI